MIMAEIKIAPSEHPVIRRWFEGLHLDLILWESNTGEMLKFRLLSRLLGDEIEGLAWTKKEGLRHGHLPVSHSERDWENLSWVNEDRKPSPQFIAAWQKEGASLPPIIYNFVNDQIKSFLISAPETKL